jgi:hypothetical protein
VTAQQQQQQQQSIVLPARTTPLTQSSIPVTQLLQTSQPTSLASPSLPTQPTTAAIQTVKIGGQATSVRQHHFLEFLPNNLKSYLVASELKCQYQRLLFI